MLGRPSTFLCLFAELIPLFALPSAAAAQVEFVPYAGVYLPTRRLLDHAQSVWCTCTLKQKTAATLGARLTLWRTSRIGAEFTLGYSPSGLSVAGAQPPETSAHVITASARALVRLSPGGSPWLVRLGGGVGFVSRGGAAYQEAGTATPSVCGTSQFAGVVNAGAGFKFGGLALRLDAEDYLYSSGLYVYGESLGCGGFGKYGCRGLGQVCNFFETTSPTNRLQDDLVLSVGLSLRLGGR